MSAHQEGEDRQFYAFASDLGVGDSFILPDSSEQGTQSREVTVLNVTREDEAGQPYWARVDLQFTDYTAAQVYVGDPPVRLTSTEGRTDALVYVRDLKRHDRTFVGLLGATVMGVEPDADGGYVVSLVDDMGDSHINQYTEQGRTKISFVA